MSVHSGQTSFPIAPTEGETPQTKLSVIEVVDAVRGRAAHMEVRQWSFFKGEVKHHKPCSKIYEPLQIL